MADGFGIKNRAKNPTYDSWAHMKARCNNPNNQDYKYYGGRGITVCENWAKYENFAKDMGLRSGNLTLDRIDSNGNYEPKNCRWIDRRSQRYNARDVKLTPHIEKIKQLYKSGLKQIEIARLFNVSKQSIFLVVHGKSYNRRELCQIS